MQIPRDVRNEWFEELKFDVQDAILARRNWWEDYQTGYMALRSIPPGPKQRPWLNCSNIIPPLTQGTYEQTVRRIVMFYVQSREYITLTANSGAVQTLGRAKKVQDLLRWEAENEFDYWNFVDSFVREFVGGGTGFGITDWAFEERMVADALVLGRDRLVQERPGSPNPAYKPVGERITRKAKLKKILNEIFGSQQLKVTGAAKNKKRSPKGIEEYLVPFSERGRKKTAFVTVDRREELGDDIEVIAELPRLVKNQPICEPLTAERVIVPPGDHDIQNAPWYGVKSYVPWDWVQRQWGAGKWISDDDEKEKLAQQYEPTSGKPVRRVPGGTRGFSWEDEVDAQLDQDQYVGVDSERFRSRLVPIIRMVRKWPILLRDKKLLPEAQMVILPRHGMIVRTQYDSIDNRSGMRNIVAHHFVKARNEFYGISLPRLLAPLQEEMNAAVNMEIDAANITSTPTIFVDHNASFERDNVGYFPGAVVKVNEPQQNVLIPQWPSRLGEFELQIQRLNAWAQDLAQQGAPQAVGRDPATPNANRTARGAQILVAERSFNVQYEAAAIAKHIQDFWKQIHAWNATHIAPGKEFAIFGTDEIARVDKREEIRGDYEFRFEAGTSTLNDEVRRALFTEAFQLTAPIAASMPEQVPRPLWNMVKEVWLQRGVKNPERFMPTPIDVFGDPLSPAQEHQIFIMGHPVRVHPSDIDQVHIQGHLQFASSEHFGLMPPAMVGPFREHVFEHYRRLQAGQTRGAGNPDQTGQIMGGALANQGNPLVNSAPGQPPTTQPQQMPQPQGGELPALSVLG
jgi:hypothetical protein